MEKDNMNHLYSQTWNKKITSGIAFPIILGIVLTCGTNGAVKAYLPITEPQFYIQMLLFILASILGFTALDRFLDRIAYNKISEENNKESVSRTSRHFWHFDHAENLKGISRDALRIIVCWLPYIILLYPGILYWDTGDQLGQFFRISAWNMAPGQIWDHHPFFDTYLYGSFIWVGHAITGSYAFGIFLHSLFQCILLSSTFAACLAYLKQCGIAKAPLSALTAFICLFPIIPIMSMTMSKDITHAIFFLLWCYLFTKIVTSKLEILSKPTFSLIFIVISLCASLSKKMGMYIIVVALFALLIIHGRARLKMACASFAIILFALISIILPKYAYPAWNIVPGSSQSAVVMPLQMLGRAAHDHPNDVTDSEKQAINSIMVYSWNQMAERYNPYISDPVTGFHFREPASRKALARAWISIGLRHPFSYINSFFSLESGWIAFVGSPSIGQQKEPYREDLVQLQPVTHTRINANTFGKLYYANSDGKDNAAQSVVKTVMRTVQALPVVNVLMYVAVWTALLPCFIVYRQWRYRKETYTRSDAIIIFPYIISVVSLFVYPVSLSVQNDSGNATRYMIHALFLAPYMIGFMLCRDSQRLRNH